MIVGLASTDFRKLLKFPIPLLQRINTRLTIYLDDILIIGKSLEEIKPQSFKFCDQYRKITTRVKYRNTVSGCKTKLKIIIKFKKLNITIYLTEEK